MRFSDRTPIDWKHTPARLVIAGAMTALMAVWASVWAINLAFRQHHLLAALTIGAWATVMAAIVAIVAVSASGAVANTVRVGDASLSVQPPRCTDILMRVLFAATLVAGIAGIVTVLRHGPDLTALVGHRTTSGRSESRQQTRLILASVLAAAVGALSSPRWLLPRSLLGSLTLTPHDVQCRRAFFGFTVDWDDIVTITDQQQNQRKTPASIAFILRDGSHKVCSAQIYGTDSAELYWMLSEYHQHPERRIEIANGVAAQRFRNQDFSATRDDVGTDTPDAGRAPTSTPPRTRTDVIEAS